MYLSKLRIFGFKSFANKAEVNFPGEGITSVVGPNGCGKSNIIDAIRWVLGEQKAKALRSSKMEDVIFSGTADRPAMSMAEVSLMINNDKGVLPSEYSQIMITRRAYRNGESEYLINNQPCRLKDIHNLFYDTGMGAASYSLIEAKMIDSILSEKADERRTMFEEASGISKYKQQRKETLRQLERTGLDLARVADNLHHIQQNVNMFERQAKKAEKWRELKRAYESLELSYQWDIFRDIRDKRAGFEGELREAGAAAQDLQSKITVQESALEERKLLILEEEKALQALNQVVAASQAEMVRMEGEARRAQDRVDHLGQSLERLEAEDRQIEGRLGEFAAAERQAQEEIGRLEGQRAELAGLAGGHEEERQRLQSEYQVRRAESDALAEERVEMLEGLSGLRNRAAAAATEGGHLESSREELERRLEANYARGREQAEGKAALEAELAALDADLAGMGGEIEAHGEAILGLTGRLEDLGRRRREAENARVEYQTRYRMLKNLSDSGEGVEGGVKHLLEKERGRIKSLLADVLRAPPESLQAVEKALGRLLQTLVVEGRGDGRALMEELRRSRKGEAAFFAPGEAPAAAPRPRPDLAGRPGFLGWLRDQVEAPPDLAPLLDLALGRYGRAADWDSAWALLPELAGGDYWLVTDTGELLHASGLAMGGQQQSAESGLLRRKAMLEEAESGLREAEARSAAAAAELQAAEADLKSHRAALDSLNARYKAAERQAQDKRSRLAVSEASLRNLEAGREQDETKLKQVSERLEELARQREDLERDLEQAEEGRRVLENRFQRALEDVKAAELERARFEERLRNLEREKSQNENNLRSQRAKVEYLDRSRQEQLALRERQARQKEEWEVQVKQERERMAAVQAQLEAVLERLDGEEKARDAAKSAYDAKAAFLDEVRLQIKNLQEDQRQATKRAHDLELKLEQARTVLANIRERMFELHEKDFAADEVEFERVDYDADTAEEEIRSLKDKLKGLGNINVGALEDYEAEKARLDEVQKQYDDLEAAREGLEKAIKKLDKVAREQFLQTFEVVRKNFQDVFSSLFEGGEAQLALEEGADPLDAKIEINARPTGKKMRGVSLLSGGERALTAISLLFALYLVRPSPYCIMDEVDGPLDDANIGRFVNLLRRFSHQTQFIVVTHNKRTMAASDMLYGVTQEIKGISKLVSVQLDEASRIAA